MANPKHLAKIKEGVEAWNQWRTRNSDLKIHLKSANLYSTDLRGANLFRVDLTDANLHCADLHRADLRGADLKGVILTNANLYRANLYRAYLKKANLRGADLKGAILTDANLGGANLSGVKLCRAQALATNFEGANLNGTCIEDWNINSQTNLQNVKCDYIYLKAIYTEEEEKKIFVDRVPHDPDKIFAPGEFTKRYQKILETVNLYFGEGIDWQVFLNSFQKLQEEERIKIADGEREIPIVQGIENTGDGSFVIKIGVSPDTDKGEIEKSFWQKYQPMLEAKDKEIKFLHEEIRYKRIENTKLIGIVETMANRDHYEIKGNYYDQKGNVRIGHISGGTISGNAKVAGVINEAAQQDLAQAAAEIQQLLDQLSKTYPTKTSSEKMVVGTKLTEEIENNPTRWQKVINVIKAMGIEAVAEAVDNPIFNIAKAGIEAALESES
ncbi:MAG: pentapeptide repeat-containing protein [Xenococcus sp. (in: cyanobacteria)]